MNTEKKIVKILKEFETINSIKTFQKLIDFGRENKNLTFNFNLHKKGYGYQDNHIYSILSGILNLQGNNFEDFEISETFPVKDIRIIDFEERSFGMPSLYMHDSKVIDQQKITSVRKDMQNLIGDIQLLCSIANSLEALQNKLFRTHRDKLIEDFNITRDEYWILEASLWHPEAILIRRLTDNHKDKPHSIITILSKLEEYGFFDDTFSVREDIVKIETNEDIQKICTYADKRVAHNDKNDCETIRNDNLKTAAKIIVEIADKYLSFLASMSYGWIIND